MNIPSKILGGGLIISLLLSGFFYIQNLHKDAQILKEQSGRAIAEANLKTAEKTIALLKEYEDVEQIIDESPDDDVAYYLRTGVWRDSSTKGNRLPAAPGPTDPKKPDRR